MYSRIPAAIRVMEKFLTLTTLPGGIYLLVFDGEDEQHRLSEPCFAAIQTALDLVEADPDASAMVSTNKGRFYSNGLDLRSSNFKGLSIHLHNLLRRMLLFPIPTVAAVCGHAAGGGCLFALAHDYRVMRSDKGFIFMNEVDLSLPMPAGLASVLRTKLPEITFHKAMLSAHRFSGKEAEVAGFVYVSLPDAISTQEEGIKKATEQAKKKLNRSVYKAIKAEMFKDTIHDLSERVVVSSL